MGAGGAGALSAVFLNPRALAALALLPNVIAVTEAIAYAHEHQIIHRDLKPSNVIVGAFGETVVIDWGLAKDLAETSGAPVLPDPNPPPATPPVARDRPADETALGDTLLALGAAAGSSDKSRAGHAMGTLAYMPPEQLTCGARAAAPLTEV